MHLAQNLPQYYNQGVSFIYVSFKVSLKEWSTSKSFTWLLAGSSSSRAVGQRTSVLCWLLAGGHPQFLPHGPLLGQHMTWQLASIRMNKQESKRKRVPKPQSFRRLILEVTYHHIFHNLFIRSKSLGPGHIWGEGIIQGHDYQEGGIISAILQAAYSNLGPTILTFHICYPLFKMVIK